MIDHALQTALRAARVASILLRKNFPRTQRVTMKDQHNVVTSTDRASERAILKVLKRAFPKSSSFAEESGHTGSHSHPTWIVDPLDGTTNFSHHFPYFGVSIALVQDDKILLGVVANPMLRETYWATAKGPAFCNGKRIHIHNCVPSRAVISMSRGGNPQSKHRTALLLPKLTKKIRTFRFHGAAALELCDVAMGHADGFLGIDMQAYDIAAGMLIAQRAGAKILNAQRKPWSFSWKPSSVAVGNPLLTKTLASIF
ncbi:MAG: inositol monophosphatase family protein [Patescibacteria group bacterium]